MTYVTTKTTCSDGIEVGVLREDGLEALAYATLGGLTVYLSEQKDGSVRVNIEPKIRGVVEAVVVSNDRDQLATVRFE